jgi:hypothetical protein
MGAGASLCEVAAVKHRSFRHEVQRAGVLLAWLVAAGVAHAQENDARLRLSTPGTCVTERGIAAGVHQRSDTVAFVARDGVPVFEVAVAQRGHDMQAELTVRWPDGRSARRRLEAQSCPQLTAAVALVISMTLEPAGEDASAEQHGGARGERAPPRGRATPPRQERASAPSRGSSSPQVRANAADARESPAARGEVEDGSGARAPEPFAADGGAATAQQPMAPATARSRDAVITTSPMTPGAAGDVEPATAAAVAHPAADGGETSFFQLDEWSIGAQATLSVGPAPRALPGLGAYAWFAWHGAPPWSPAVRLDFAHAWLDAYAATGGKASFALTTAGLEVCPLGLQAGPFSGHACASARFGALAARGTDTYRPAARTQPWSAFGAALLASVRVTSWAELQLGAALRAPAARDRFAFAPNVFHRVGWLAFELRASLGVRFP